MAEQLSGSDAPVVVVDVLGGDNGHDVVLTGVDLALAADPRVEVLACGPAQIVDVFASTRPRVQPLHATQNIEMNEHPASAVRAKKDSTIVVGCKAVKEGRAQGFFSAGSTGACLAGATLFIGRIRGISRPALCHVIPSPAGNVVMSDIGANADCKPEWLVQFAQMATVYAEKIVGKEHPSVALLNIGSEDTKGSQFAQECHQVLKDNLPNFAGNAEGGDLVCAKYDVVVTDGFTGNVALKTLEGTSKELLKAVKGVMMSNLATKLGALAMKRGLNGLKTRMSADTYGGAPLLGVNGVCLIGHGNSNPEAIKSGILATARMIEANLVEEIVKVVK